MDWRERFGWPWITSVQAQLCEDCWVFSATALIEAMVRIEHCAWFKGSEFELRWAYLQPPPTPRVFSRTPCADGGGPEGAIQYAVHYGVCDEACEPYTQSNAPFSPCADFSGRSVRLAPGSEVAIEGQSPNNPNYEMQKAWLDLNGPFIVFLAAAGLGAIGSGVFQGLPGANPDHFVLAVGYDDSKNAWICKNSWGANWNGDGYFYLEYGAAGSGGGNGGLYNTNPDPWTKRRLHAGALLESGNGDAHRNLELISTTTLTSGGGALQHYWRDGTSLVWNLAAGQFGANADMAGFPSLLSSTYNRNFECVYVSTAHELVHIYFEQASNQWLGGTNFGPANCRGRAGFIQSNYGMPGNFEVVVATLEGKLSHWTRTIGLPWWPSSGKQEWWEAAEFGQDILFAGPSLIQSRYGVRGNFEMVVTLTDGTMQHFWRDNDGGGVWHEGVMFGENIASPPVMIEGPYGATDENTPGNFELCVAIEGGGVQHWQRDNVNNTGWHLKATFGQEELISDVVGLVQGSLGFDFEAVAIDFEGELVCYSRNSVTENWETIGGIGPA